MTSVDVDANGTATVEWSDTLGGTARAVGSSVTLPTALNVPSTSLIWSEVSIQLQADDRLCRDRHADLSDQLYMRPRLSDKVERIPS